MLRGARRFLVLALTSLVGACSPSGPTAPTVKVKPTSVTLAAGAVEQRFTATVSGGGTVAWTLAGAGSLSAASGLTTDYTPPASVPSSQAATLTASVSGVSTNAFITVVPVSATAGNLSIYFENLVETNARGNILVTGPSGFTATLDASRTLLDLEPGSYTVNANAVRVRQGTLDAVRQPELECPAPSVPGGATCTVVVVAGATARVHAVYQLDPKSGRVYLPSYFDGQVGAYGASQLASSNSEPPTFLLEGTPSAESVAFDASGNLWVSDWDLNSIRKFGADTLSASGSPEPLVTLSFGGLANPTALAFDSMGNLWVSNRGNSSISRYDAAQELTSGSPPPAAYLSNSGALELSGPTSIAFDGDGRLWIVNTFSRQLFRYDDPGALVGETSALPDAVIESASFTGPVALAFSAGGDLWVSDDTALLMFSREQLAASGAVLPAVTLDGLAAPSGLAFDAAGDLWATDTGSSLLSFTPEQLAASGSPTPNVVVTGFEGVGIGLLAFYPPPAGVPLAQPVPGIGPF